MEKKNSPQLENGYIKISNEVWEALGRYRLSGEESLVLNCIIRKTWGYNKKEDWISESQIVKYTKLTKQSIFRARKKLAVKNVIVTKKGYFNHNIYSFNKHYSTWKEVTKKGYSNQYGLQKSSKKVTRSNQKRLLEVTKKAGDKRHIQKTYTKDIITKDKDNTIVLSGAKSRRNPEIDLILKTLQEKLELPKLDLSEKVNRQYAWNLLRKSKKGIEGVLWLISQAASDGWFKNHITSVRDLWNNQVKIIAVKRGGDKNGKRGIKFYVAPGAK